jgi:hypothetical protein
MPALLSEVFKETSFSVHNGQIQPQYEKTDSSPKASDDNTNILNQNIERRQWEERVKFLMQQNNQLQEQIKAMQQKIESIVQQGGTKFDLLSFVEQNPVITIIIILIGIDLFTKAFLK